MQVAVLCQHAAPDALRAMKKAIRKCCARTPWCVTATIDWAIRVHRILPARPHVITDLLAVWLKTGGSLVGGEIWVMAYPA